MYNLFERDTSKWINLITLWYTYELMVDLGDGGPPDFIPQAPDISIEYTDWSELEPEREDNPSGPSFFKINSENNVYPVVIKSLKHSGTLDKNEVTSFVNKCDIWGKLADHNNITDVLSYSGRPIPWVAIEYMDGGSLNRIIKRGRLPPKQALWVTYYICQGLFYAHRHGVVHHNIKPTNILFRTVENGWNVPKISDWGLGQMLIDEADNQPQLSTRYAAPEQIDETKFGSPDEITDIYQVGLICYELITGCSPFQGNSENLKESILSKEPKPPSSIIKLPQVIDKTILTALQKNKESRYDSIAYLRDNLKKILKWMMTDDEFANVLTAENHSSLTASHQGGESSKSLKEDDGETVVTKGGVKLSRRAIVSIFGGVLGIGGLGAYAVASTNQFKNPGESTNSSVQLQNIFGPFASTTSLNQLLRYDDNVLAVGDKLTEVDPNGPEIIRDLDFSDIHFCHVKSGDNLYIGTTSREKNPTAKIHKINLSDWRLVWTFEWPYVDTTAYNIAASDKYIAAVSHLKSNINGKKTLFVLSNNGETLDRNDWEENGPSGGNIIIMDDRILLGDFNDTIKYPLPNGSERNQHDSSMINPNGHMTRDGNRLYSTRDYLVGSDLTTNERLFESQFPGTTFSSPVILEESLIISGQSGVYLFNKQTGERIWGVRTTDMIRYQPVVLNDHVYVIDDAAILYVIDIKDGELLYESKFEDKYARDLIRYKNSLLIFGNALYRFKPKVVR